MIKLSHEMKARLRHTIGPMFGASLVLYFAFHAVQGDRGLIRWWQLRQEMTRVERIAADVHTQRISLAERVKLLKPDTLDRDMLEERARLMLGWGYEGELVIPLVPPVTPLKDRQ